MAGDRVNAWDGPLVVSNSTTIQEDWQRAAGWGGESLNWIQ